MYCVFFLRRWAQYWKITNCKLVELYEGGSNGKVSGVGNIDMGGASVHTGAFIIYKLINI